MSQNEDIYKTPTGQLRSQLENIAPSAQPHHHRLQAFDNAMMKIKSKQIKAYTKKDGTYVGGYNRSK